MTNRELCVVDQTWLSAWHREANAALAPFLASFEEIFGYPPGDNTITAADDGDFAARRQLGAHPAVPRALAAFYETIGEVLLPDVGNGYFIHPPGHVLEELTHDGPVQVTEHATGVVFGSDGGGILFAIDSTGRIHRSRAASRSSGFDAISTDLRDFLDQLRRVLARFIATGNPRWE